jgi:hypothetical protein
MSHAADWSLDQHVVRFARSHGPVQALQFKLVEFLKGIRVADVVQPGRRIDVPSQRLRLTLKRDVKRTDEAEPLAEQEQEIRNGD